MLSGGRTIILPEVNGTTIGAAKFVGVVGDGARPCMIDSSRSKKLHSYKAHKFKAAARERDDDGTNSGLRTSSHCSGESKSMTDRTHGLSEYGGSLPYLRPERGDGRISEWMQ
jgi:hypothetical protein